jgi:L-malate glycosyltransferase
MDGLPLSGPRRVPAPPAAGARAPRPPADGADPRGVGPAPPYRLHDVLERESRRAGPYARRADRAGLNMRRIKVLHLIKSLNRGGAETLLSEGLRFADAERFELSYGYFHPELDALVGELRATGATVTCFDAPGRATMLLHARRIARHLREQRIGLLHCHMPLAGAVGRVAGRLAGVPVVYTEHNKVEWYRRPTFWLNALTYRWQAHVIAVSESVRDSIDRYLRPVVPVSVVRNGIDAAHFTRYPRGGDAVRQAFGIPAGAPVVGNVAAFIPQKRVGDWAAAAGRIRRDHPEARFLWVGEGPQRGDLLAAAARAGIGDALHLAGVQEDVRPYLAAMDVYMMSSAFEGLPVALLEAMAMGCAPVCTAAGGVPEVIRTGYNGAVTEVGRPDQLAGAAADLLACADRRATVAAAARRTVETDFAIERMARELEEVYLRVLGRPGRGSSGAVPRRRVA